MSMNKVRSLSCGNILNPGTRQQNNQKCLASTNKNGRSHLCKTAVLDASASLKVGFVLFISTWAVKTTRWHLKTLT